MKTTRVAPVSGRSFVRKDSQTLTGLSTKPTVNEKQVGEVRKHSPDPNQLDERASCRLLWILALNSKVFYPRVAFSLHPTTERLTL